MLNAARLALGQLFDPAFRLVLWRALVLTMSGLSVLGGGLYWVIAKLAQHLSGWLQKSVDVLAGLGLIAGSVLLIPVVAVTVVSLFLDEAADQVETKYYPALPQGRSLAMGPALRTGLSFLVVSLGLNLVALPLYLLPGPNIAVYLVLNGYLAGREYFELVALRHVDPAAAKALRRRHGLKIYGAGALIALAFAVPILNLLAPLFGVAFMVHVFNDLQRQTPVPA